MLVTLLVSDQSGDRSPSFSPSLGPYRLSRFDKGSHAKNLSKFFLLSNRIGGAIASGATAKLVGLPATRAPQRDAIEFSRLRWSLGVAIASNPCPFAKSD